MSIQDVQLGRQTYTGEISATVGTTASEVLGQSPNRVGLIISPPSTGIVSLSSSPNVSLGGGIIMQQGSDPLTLNIEHNGDIVRKALYAVGNVGGQTITFITTLLDQQ